MKKADYKVVNIDEDLDALAELHTATGRSITPTTLVVKEDGSKDYIVGYNLGRIFPAIA